MGLFVSEAVWAGTDSDGPFLSRLARVGKKRKVDWAFIALRSGPVSVFRRPYRPCFVWVKGFKGPALSGLVVSSFRGM